MDNKMEKYTRLRVIENTEDAVEKVSSPVYSKHINPMYKSVLKFHHENIAKFSVKDLW